MLTRVRPCLIGVVLILLAPAAIAQDADDESDLIKQRKEAARRAIDKAGEVIAHLNTIVSLLDNYEKYVLAHPDLSADALRSSAEATAVDWTRAAGRLDEMDAWHW